MNSIAGKQDNKTLLLLRRIFSYTVLIFLTLLSLFPIYVLFINASRNHAAIQGGFSILPGMSFAKNFLNVLKDENTPIFTGLINSLIIASCSAGLSVYFSTMTAYGLHAYKFKGNNTAFKFIIMIMMVPTQVSALGFINFMFKLGLKDSFIPLIVPSIAAPATFFFMIQYMESALPLEIVEAARIDGSGEIRTFNNIVLAMMKPALAVQAIFTFVANWNNYFTPALILTKAENKTLPIMIAMLRSADWLKFDMGKVYMLILLSILPVVIVYLLLSKFIIGGVALGGVKG